MIGAVVVRSVSDVKGIELELVADSDSTVAGLTGCFKCVVLTVMHDLGH